MLYLVFNEGYSATAGDDWMRPELSNEALRLARLTSSLVPAQAEVHGLVALLELTQARAPARNGSDGMPILLQHQDRRLWDPVRGELLNLAGRPEEAAKQFDRAASVTRNVQERMLLIAQAEDARSRAGLSATGI